MKPLHCHGCGVQFARSHGADLFCKPECAMAHQITRQECADALVKAGFKVTPSASNVFFKNGVGITVEQVLHEGIDQTLARHAEAVRQRKPL